MNMKRIGLTLLILSVFCIYCFGQTEVDVHIRVPSGSSVEDNLYWINGISTADDIGGVVISYSVSHTVGDTTYYNLVLQNYNRFTVTVIYEVQVNYPGGGSEKIKDTGTAVLRQGETITTSNFYWNPSNAVLIVRRLQN